MIHLKIDRILRTVTCKRKEVIFEIDKTDIVQKQNTLIIAYES